MGTHQASSSLQPQRNHKAVSPTLDPQDSSKTPARRAHVPLHRVETEAPEGAMVFLSQGRMVLVSRTRATRFHLSCPPLAPTAQDPRTGLCIPPSQRAYCGAEVLRRLGGPPPQRWAVMGSHGQAGTGRQTVRGLGDGWGGGALETQTEKREAGRRRAGSRWPPLHRFSTGGD